jgi:hypothetical protein
MPQKQQACLITILTVFAVIIFPAATAAQGPDSAITASRNDVGFLPSIDFRPLIADPHEPQLGGSLRAGDFAQRGLEAIASIGSTFGLFGFAAQGGKSTVQIGGSGGVFARFDLHARGNIVSEDYEIALPVYVTSGRFGARVRMFHRSAHIGDEYAAVHPDFTRFDLSYEAIEAVIAESFGAGRIYTGGDYQVHNATTPIEPGTLRAGADFVSRSAFGSGSLRGRWVAGVDFQASRDLSWRVAKSAVAGIQVTRAGTSLPSLRILAELFSGPSNAGQFYGEKERYIGLAGYITR